MAQQLHVGARIDIPSRNKYNCGVVKFLGPTNFHTGTWVGIELDTPWGKNDGCVKGERYFPCKPKSGLFLRPHQCQVSVVQVEADATWAAVSRGTTPVQDGEVLSSHQAGLFPPSASGQGSVPSSRFTPHSEGSNTHMSLPGPSSQPTLSSGIPSTTPGFDTFGSGSVSATPPVPPHQLGVRPPRVEGHSLPPHQPFSRAAAPVSQATSGPFPAATPDPPAPGAQSSDLPRPDPVTVPATNTSLSRTSSRGGRSSVDTDAKSIDDAIRKLQQDNKSLAQELAALRTETSRVPTPRAASSGLLSPAAAAAVASVASSGSQQQPGTSNIGSAASSSGLGSATSSMPAAMAETPPVPPAVAQTSSGDSKPSAKAIDPLTPGSATLGALAAAGISPSVLNPAASVTDLGVPEKSHPPPSSSAAGSPRPSLSSLAAIESAAAVAASVPPNPALSSAAGGYGTPPHSPPPVPTRSSLKSVTPSPLAPVLPPAAPATSASPAASYSKSSIQSSPATAVTGGTAVEGAVFDVSGGRSSAGISVQTGVSSHHRNPLGSVSTVSSEGNMPAASPPSMQAIMAERDAALAEVEDLRRTSSLQYSNLSADLQASDARLSSLRREYQIRANALEVERDTAEERAQELEDDLKTCREQLQVRQQDIRLLQQKVEKLEREHSRTSSVEKELDRERAKVTSLMGQLRTAEAAAAAGAKADTKVSPPPARGLAAEVVALRSRMGTVETELVRAKERSARADEALATAQTALEDAGHETTRLRRLLGEREGDLQDAQSREEELESMMANMQEELDSMRLAAERFESQNEGYVSQIAELKKELESNKEQLAESNANLAAEQEKIKSLMSQVDGLKEEVQRALQASEASTAAADEAKVEAVKWRAACDEMQQRLAAAEPAEPASPDAKPAKPAFDVPKLISELQANRKRLEEIESDRDVMKKDLEIASAYGASLMAEKDLLAAEKEEQLHVIEALKARVAEKKAEIEQISATNQRLINTLDDADGSMGGLTKAIQKSEAEVSRLNEALSAEKTVVRDLKRAAAQQRATDKERINTLTRELEVQRAKEGAMREMLALAKLPEPGSNFNASVAPHQPVAGNLPSRSYGGMSGAPEDLRTQVAMWAAKAMELEVSNRSIAAQAQEMKELWLREKERGMDDRSRYGALFGYHTAPSMPMAGPAHMMPGFGGVPNGSGMVPGGPLPNGTQLPVSAAMHPHPAKSPDRPPTHTAPTPVPTPVIAGMSQSRASHGTRTSHVPPTPVDDAGSLRAPSRVEPSPVPAPAPSSPPVVKPAVVFDVPSGNEIDAKKLAFMRQKREKKLAEHAARREATRAKLSKEREKEQLEEKKTADQVPDHNPPRTSNRGVGSMSPRRPTRGGVGAGGGSGGGGGGGGGRGGFSASNGMDDPLPARSSHGRRGVRVSDGSFGDTLGSLSGDTGTGVTSYDDEPLPRTRSFARSVDSESPVPLPPVLHAASGPVLKAQHRRVKAALTQVLLAGIHQSDKLSTALAAKEASNSSQVVIVFYGTGNKRGTFAGLYAMEEDLSRGNRVYGSGPMELNASVMSAYFKYDTAARTFKEIESSQFTVTTDAVNVDVAQLHGKGQGRSASRGHARPGHTAGGGSILRSPGRGSKFNGRSPSAPAQRPPRRHLTAFGGTDSEYSRSPRSARPSPRNHRRPSSP